MVTPAPILPLVLVVTIPADLVSEFVNDSAIVLILFSYLSQTTESDNNSK